MFSAPKTWGHCSAWRPKKNKKSWVFFFFFFFFHWWLYSSSRSAPNLCTRFWGFTGFPRMQCLFPALQQLCSCKLHFWYIHLYWYRSIDFILYTLWQSVKLVVVSSSKERETTVRYQKSLFVARLRAPLNWLPSQAALGLPQQAVKIQGVILAFRGGRVKVVRMRVQVCVMWFAELLLSAEAQFELGLVWPA